MLSIDEDRLTKDLIKTVESVYDCKNKGKRYKDYGEYCNLNEMFELNFGKTIILNEEIFNLEKIIEKYDKMELEKINKHIINSKDSLLKIASSFNEKMYYMLFQEVPFFDKQRRYNEKDFKDLILGYFSTFGNDIYKIAEKYLKENKIQIGCVMDSGSDAAYYSLQSANAGYIYSLYNQYDSYLASTIAHELGHAIDCERFWFPQQKLASCYSDLLIEVPSTTFELGFLDYLKDNHIDIESSRILYNMIIEYINQRFVILNNVLSQKSFTILDDGLAYCEDKGVYEIRNSIIYGLGYYISLHLNMIRSKDNKDFLDRLNTLMTSRMELSLDSLIEKIGFNLDDFTSGKYIESKVENEFLELRKRYKF